MICVIFIDALHRDENIEQATAMGSLFREGTKSQPIVKYLSNRSHKVYNTKQKFYYGVALKLMVYFFIIFFQPFDVHT